MSKKSSRHRNKPEVRTEKPDRAAVAARDPAPGAGNRPGFDLGGAVGDAKPDDENRIKGATGLAAKQGAVNEKEAAGRATGDAGFEAEGKAGRTSGKVRSAVAGVRNWLRGR